MATPKQHPADAADHPASHDHDDAWQGVPCFDLEAIERGTPRESAHAVGVLRAAFERFGFVRLVGHDISPSRLERVDAAFRAFFDRPEHEKSACAGVAGGQRGYTPFGREHAKGHARPDLKSFFHVGQPEPIGPEAGTYPRNVFPEDDDELRVTSLELFVALERAARSVLRGVERGFGLPPGVLADMVRGGNSILRALDYPALAPEEFVREAAEAGLGGGLALRAAAHEDINLVTLLPASSEEGLEILVPGVGPDPAPSWQPVMGRPGEIIADVGDMLARLTGGRLPATTHRVVVDAGSAAHRRTAYPFFAHPRPECDLSVRSEFIDPGDSAPFAPITAGEFLAERLIEIGLVEAR